MPGEPQSNNAIRVLDTLKCFRATAAHRAITHATLADFTELRHRDIIDATGELIGHGYLLLAGPRGCWLGTVAEAQRNRDSLRMRAKKIFIRARNLRNGIRAHAVRQLTLALEQRSTT